MDELKGIKQPFMFRPFLGEEHGRIKGPAMVNIQTNHNKQQSDKHPFLQ
jgi:hypothetical protein